MRLLQSIALLFLVSVIGLQAQECKVYIPATIGTETELTMYDKKDKPTSLMHYKLMDIKQSGDSTIYYVHSLSTDEKGKNPVEGNFTYKCYGENFLIDMNTFFDPKTMAAYQGMQMKMTTENIIIPAHLEAGQQLKNGFVKMEILGPIPMTMKIDIQNRKVEGFEDVTTSAGTFSCVKIAEDVLGNFGFVKTNFHTVTWYSDKVGTVRSETYKQEKLESYMVLTSIKR